MQNCFSAEMYPIRETQLMRALSACAGAYYDFNLTRNVIIGTPVQIVDGKTYSIHEAVGLHENCPYTTVIEFWGNKLDPEEQKAFFDFFAVEHLMECFHNGQRHIAHKYWTKDVLGNPMLAEQTILLYEDVTNGDILGLTYVKDLQVVDALVYKSQHDDLTGLYNREGFLVKVQEMMQEESDELCIVRVNVRHFKLINELRGTAQGDKLLQSIGANLNEKSRESGFVAGRFAADQFYLCISRKNFECLELHKRITIPWLKMNVTIAYGVYPADKETPVTAMCDRATMALSSNNRKGLENVHYYDNSFHQQLLDEQEIENEMEQALAEGQFCIYIQPKFDVDTEQIVGGEALVRWNHPQKGMIPPLNFIKIFEKNGFILPLDYFVWEESCRFLAEAKKAGMQHYPISVNVSRMHFYSGELLEKLTGLLEKYQLDAGDLELEITESIYAEDPESILLQCSQLQALGFKIVMDDFGSGFSSLNMLKQMPLDIIKMDLRFLTEDSNPEQALKGRDILRTQIELAHAIGQEVVVEGLETSEQKDFIREIGNCAAQGYYYARPMPVPDYAGLLEAVEKGEFDCTAYGMSAELRRERLRQEQLQPLLEVIGASENLFGYLLPEKKAYLSLQLAWTLSCPQWLPDLAEAVKEDGIFSPGCIPQWEALIDAADQGGRTGSAIIEYASPMGGTEMYWLQFNTVMDYEGNPLIAIFSVMDFEDVSAQVDALLTSRQSQAELENRRLKENEKLLSVITQHSDRVVCLYNVQKRSSQVWNSEMCKNCQMPRLCETTAEGMLESDVFTSESKDALRQMFSDIDHGVSSGGTKVRLYGEDGELRWVDVLFTTVCDEKGKPESALISYRDVTKQYEHEMAYLRQYQSLSETESSLGIMEVDLTVGRIELQESLFAPMEQSAIGKSLVDFAEQMITLKMREEHWKEAREFFAADYMLYQYESGNRLLSRTWPMTFLSGTEGWVRFDVELIADIYTEHIRAYFRLWDVTSQRERQLEIQKRAERDGMTGLYNRATTEELIGEELGTESPRGIFVILDMDRLKQINDSYGHKEGDVAIISVAKTLRSHFRDRDIIGRIGGDEFVAYLPGSAKNKEVIARSITELLRKMGALSAGENADMGVTCSIGCAVAQEDSTYESLYKQADKALYHVKKKGRNNFAFYTPEMEKADFVFQAEKMFSLDQAKHSESSDVQHLLTALSEYYHLVLCCNITENSYHLMQEVKDGIFSLIPTFGKMDNMVAMSEMRMPPEDAKRFDDAVSRHALLEAGERGDKYVAVYFDFQDFDGKYYPAECTSILYRNEKGDLCEFALIRWRR